MAEFIALMRFLRIRAGTLFSSTSADEFAMRRERSLARVHEIMILSGKHKLHSSMAWNRGVHVQVKSRSAPIRFLFNCVDRRSRPCENEPIRRPAAERGPGHPVREAPLPEPIPKDYGRNLRARSIIS